MTPSSRSRSREFARANVQLYTYRFLVVAPGNNTIGCLKKTCVPLIKTG